MQLNLEGEEEEEEIDIPYFNKLQHEASRQPLQLGARQWGWHLHWLQGVSGVLSPPGWCSWPCQYPIDLLRWCAVKGRWFGQLFFFFFGR